MSELDLRGDNVDVKSQPAPETGGGAVSGEDSCAVRQRGILVSSGK